MAVDGIDGTSSQKAGRDEPVSKHQIDDSAWVWRLSGLTRDGAAESVSRDQILRRYYERGQGKVNFPCSTVHEQGWQPQPVDSQSEGSDDHK